MALIKHGNNALSNVTAFPSVVPTGKPVLISTATASASASISFTSGIDSTYDIYKFEFINIHPSVDSGNFNFNLSIDNGSNYNVTKTSTAFRALHTENDNTALLQYETPWDLAQSTSDQSIAPSIGFENDESASGYLHLFNPSSTTYVKHYISTSSAVQETPYAYDFKSAGYGNTISAINAIIFRMSSGNIDAGTIKLYGISS